MTKLTAKTREAKAGERASSAAPSCGTFEALRLGNVGGGGERGCVVCVRLRSVLFGPYLYSSSLVCFFLPFFFRVHSWGPRWTMPGRRGVSETAKCACCCSSAYSLLACLFIIVFFCLLLLHTTLYTHLLSSWFTVHLLFFVRYFFLAFVVTGNRNYNINSTSGYQHERLRP